MSVRSIIILPLTLLATAAAQSACAQNTLPSPGLHIEVHASYQTRVGDTVTIAYTVLVQHGSTDSLSKFVVDAPSVVSVLAPTAPLGWSVGNRFHSRPVADWGNAAQYVPPDDSTPPMVLRAVGLTDAKQYWADGGIHLSSDIIETVSDSTVPHNDTTVTMLGPTGWTLGVSAMPADISAAGLAARLSGLITRACDLGWIDNHGICNSLAVKAVASAGPLNALLSELNAQRGKHVNEAAYALLTDNVKFLLTRL